MEQWTAFQPVLISPFRLQAREEGRLRKDIRLYTGIHILIRKAVPRFATVFVRDTPLAGLMPSRLQSWRLKPDFSLRLD